MVREAIRGALGVGDVRGVQREGNVGHASCMMMFELMHVYPGGIWPQRPTALAVFVCFFRR